MHNDLVEAFDKMITILMEDSRCIGGWHYGSISRGEEDAYSDFDPVFIVEDKYFESFASDVPEFLKQVCDELLIFWGEPFNDGHFKNYCSVIRLGENLHQLDFFIINTSYPNDWMCRQHCKGCSSKDLIFDKTGLAEEFLQAGYTTENNIPDTLRAIDSYYFHLEMLIKYFKRQDNFKLIKNLHVLFESHVDLLLSHYDCLDYGPWESKVKKCLPIEKQNHLLDYYDKADLHSFKKTVCKVMNTFKEDAKEICDLKKLEFKENVANQIMEYVLKNI